MLEIDSYGNNKKLLEKTQKFHGLEFPFQFFTLKLTRSLKKI